MRRAVVALISFGLLAPISTATGSSAASGLHGLVELSPARPVCIEGKPCSKPAPAVLLLFRNEGRIVARVKTRADGTYRVMLRPGRYTVLAPEYRRGSGITPRVVRVVKGSQRRVDLEIDTGLQ
jgi:hypothetical protein